MKTFALLFVLVVFAATATAQNNPRVISGNVWLDAFGGPQGGVFYPQYSWGAKTPIGNLNGYGFVEVAPHEPFFTNHLVIYSPIPPFSVQTETGGIPRKHLGLFQIGPRINIHEVVPALKKPLHHLLVTALPRFRGIRPNNLLLSGATNQFKVATGFEVSVEAYRRFFAGGRPDYSEYWLLVHPKKTKPVSFATFFLQDGSRKSIAFGIRIVPPERH